MAAEDAAGGDRSAAFMLSFDGQTYESGDFAKVRDRVRETIEAARGLDGAYLSFSDDEATSERVLGFIPSPEARGPPTPRPCSPTTSCSWRGRAGATASRGSDMWGHTVHRISVDGAVSDVVHVPARPSGLGFLRDGTLLVVPMANRVVRRLEGGRVVVHADVSGTVNADLNDLVVDSHDRAYLENCGYDLFAGADPKRQS